MSINDIWPAKNWKIHCAYGQNKLKIVDNQQKTKSSILYFECISMFVRMKIYLNIVLQKNYNYIFKKYSFLLLVLKRTELQKSYLGI